MDYLSFTILLILYFALHSLLAASKVKVMFINRVGAASTYRLLYNAIAIITLAPIIYFYFQLEKLAVFNAGWLVRTLGGLLAISGLLIIGKALKQYDLREFTGLKSQERKAATAPQLVMSGMNAWVRHPLYFGVILLAIGFFLYRADYPALILLSIILLYLLIGTRLEEQKLIEEFGEQYIDYRRKVPGLFPWR